MSIQIVVARYKEPLTWLQDAPFCDHPVVVYNKGGNDDFVRPLFPVAVVPLPNVGVDAHTFVYHIVANYDQLADYTVFLQGSVDLEHKYRRAVQTLRTSLERQCTVLSTRWAPHPVQPTYYNFTLDKYELSHTTNTSDKRIAYLSPCPIRPFGKWYESMFGNIATGHIVYNHIMCVKREDIHKRPLAFYVGLLQMFGNEPDVQPELAHYVERAWEAVFHPLEERNFIYGVAGDGDMRT